jgi:hypothetical protein
LTFVIVDGDDGYTSYFDTAFDSILDFVVKAQFDAPFHELILNRRSFLGERLASYQHIDAPYPEQFRWEDEFWGRSRRSHPDHRHIPQRGAVHGLRAECKSAIVSENPGEFAARLGLKSRRRSRRRSAGESPSFQTANS